MREINGSLKSDLTKRGLITAVQSDFKAGERLSRFGREFMIDVLVTELEKNGRSPMSGCSNYCSRTCGSQSYSRCC